MFDRRKIINWLLCLLFHLPAVNSINVIRAHFLYKRLFSSYVLALAKKFVQKSAQKMLMKLTPRVNFTKINLPSKKCTVFGKKFTDKFHQHSTTLNYPKIMLKFSKSILQFAKRHSTKSSRKKVWQKCWLN
jgi:hypothetical protein